MPRWLTVSEVRRSLVGRCTLAVALFGFSGVAAAYSPGDPPTNVGDRSSCSPACLSELARARVATKAYHDDARAQSDGFVPIDSDCFSSPDGAMGIHYLNLGRYADLNLASYPSYLDTFVDPSRPEFLLYFPGVNGGPRQLAGVEYGAVVFQNGMPYYGSDPPAPSAINPPPTLFGHKFDGPMRGHVAEQPWHYDLHVWIWSDNPAGAFAPWNPAWNCNGTYTPTTAGGAAQPAPPATSASTTRNAHQRKHKNKHKHRNKHRRH